MVKTLYVGNLSWTAKDSELAALVEQTAQPISARIISDKETGKSKGFGFVEVNDEDAEKVIKALNGADLGGRSITVSEARPKKERNEGS